MYTIPYVQTPGFLVGIKPEALQGFEYPGGHEWQRLFDEGVFQREYDHEAS